MCKHYLASSGGFSSSERFLVSEWFRLARSPCAWTDNCEKAYRYVYWADGPDGGVGVSFVDPYASYKEDESGKVMDCHGGYFDDCSDEYHLWSDGDARVISISKNSDSELGTALAVELIGPMDGLHENWRRTHDEEGRPFENVLLSWSKWHEEWEDAYDGERHKYVVTDVEVANDYTNRPFNYLYIKKLLQNEKLLKAVDSESLFTDGVRVNRRTGYFSPAYAISLYKSLKKHSLLAAAMKSYQSFVRHHPCDPIVSMCEAVAEKKFHGIEYLKDSDPMAEEVNDCNGCRNDCLRDREDPFYGDPFYVDGCPVYDADDEEDAEIIYWNTH